MKDYKTIVKEIKESPQQEFSKGFVVRMGWVPYAIPAFTKRLISQECKNIVLPSEKGERGTRYRITKRNLLEFVAKIKNNYGK